MKIKQKLRLIRQFDEIYKIAQEIFMTESEKKNRTFMQELQWVKDGNTFFTKKWMIEKYKDNPKALLIIEKL